MKDVVSITKKSFFEKMSSAYKIVFSKDDFKSSVCLQMLSRVLFKKL